MRQFLRYIVGWVIWAEYAHKEALARRDSTISLLFFGGLIFLIVPTVGSLCTLDIAVIIPSVRAGCLYYLAFGFAFEQYMRLCGEEQTSVFIRSASRFM